MSQQQELRVAELDFDAIKQNFKTFLRTKPEFTDYEYEGSTLSILLDLLAYNTHYNAVIANMLSQEMFLDTAVKRQSLGLIAKRLGYTPKSIRSASCVVNVEAFPTDSPSTLTLPKNTKFTSKVNNNISLTFVNRDAITINRSLDGRYIFSGVKLYEGENSQFRYVVSGVANQRFEIPSSLVDTSTVRVFIQTASNSTEIVEWRQFSNVLDVKSDTECYFIKMNEKALYEVYFGDGVIGKSLSTGNVVIIDYVTTNGPIANNASVFTLTESIGTSQTFNITTVSSAFGGAFAESNDSIRKNAQNRVLTQNRAVTSSDYVSIISEILPIQTINVSGGETLTPPQYGKVFISAKLSGTTQVLSDEQKSIVLTELKKRSVMSLVHEFIDPEYTYIVLNSIVKFSPMKTTMSESSIKTAIINRIIDYRNRTLDTFDSDFEYSNLVTEIDKTDVSILANDTEFKLKKKQQFIHNISKEYTFNFGTALKQSNNKETHIISNKFRVSEIDSDVQLTDIDGELRAFYKTLNNEVVYLDGSYGKIYYSEGIIYVNMISISSSFNQLEFVVSPSVKLILPAVNSILTIDPSDITVTVLAA